MRLPYAPTQLPNLGQPGPVLREGVVADLLLPSLAPPASVAVCLADPVPQIGPDGGVSCQQLVITSCHCLWSPSEKSVPELPSRGGLVH